MVEADVELDELAQACAEGFAPDADATGIRVEVQADPTVVHADPDRLAQVVANLLDNALKHAQTTVRVTVAEINGRARLQVDDDGAGIDPSDLPHVFERLYTARQQQQARHEVGSGLGLAIVRELIHSSRGEVGAGASVLGGACLWFELPAR